MRVLGTMAELIQRRTEKALPSRTKEGEDVEVKGREDEMLEKWAGRLLFGFVSALVLSFLCLYFYWGYHMSRRVTIYFLSRDAWNFDFWPFQGLERH